MISLISMAYASFFGGGLGEVFAQWEQQGIFAYVIPFLLIFSIVYGLLIQSKIFGDGQQTFTRTLDAIIALSVSLLSLQFDLVPRFFTEVFPRLGVGLAVMLIAVILMGIFSPKKTGVIYMFFAIGLIVFVVILTGAFQSFGWSSQFGSVLFFIEQYLWVIILIGLLLVVVLGSRPKATEADISSVFAKGLFGGDK